MLQLNYKLTDEDYIEFNEFHQLIHSEVGKRNLFKLRLIGPMISILAIVIFILARAEIMLIVTEVIVLCIFSIVCVTQAKKIMKRGIRKTILKMKETEGLPFAGETTLNFTEDQIIEITKGQEVKVDYKKVEDVCETEEAFFLSSCFINACKRNKSNVFRLLVGISGTLFIFFEPFIPYYMVKLISLRFSPYKCSVPCLSTWHSVFL